MNAPRRGPGGYDGGQAIEAVGTGRVDAVALRSDALGRIDSWEPRLGAVTAILQRRPASTGSLAGLVVGVKDQVDMEGHPHPIAGHGVAVPVAAARDAPVVTRLEAAGATIVARTASPPPGSPGGVTPQTANPRQPDRISGGSSGGSAAAVAAGLVHAAIGTDSGGSIRIPAACCGVVGLNPTRGLVPLDRTGGLTYSIGSVGPLASTVADVRRVLAAIADPRPGDDQRDDQIGRSAGHLRIGVPGSVLGAKLDSDVRQGLEVVLSLLRDAGHEVDRVQVPMVDESMELGPRTVGVAEYAACLADEFPSALGTPEHRALRQAAASITSTRLARAYHRIGLLRAAVLRVLEDVDFLLTPTLPCQVPAGSEAHREAEVDVGGGVETRTSALTRLVNPWNLAGVPASSQPVARDSEGAPISVQLIGPPFSEGRLLDLMELVERLTGGSWDTVAPPSVTPRR